jgi:hypothetical protein
MLQLKVRRVTLISVTYTMGCLGFLLGLLGAIVDCVRIMATPDRPPPIVHLFLQGADLPLADSPGVLCIQVLSVLPVAGLIGYGVAGFIVGLLYNLASKVTGGITIKPEIVVAAGRAEGKKSEISYEDYIRQHPTPPLSEQ